MEKGCALAFSPCLAQQAFWKHPGPPAQGRCHPQWAGPSSISHQSWKCHRLTHRPTWWGQFLNWGFFFSNDSSLCQVDIFETKNIGFFFPSYKWCPLSEGFTSTVSYYISLQQNGCRHCHRILGKKGEVNSMRKSVRTEHPEVGNHAWRLVYIINITT